MELAGLEPATSWVRLRRSEHINLTHGLTRASESSIGVGENRLKRRADARTRTGDPFITSEVLYQLSYVGGDADCSRASEQESGAPLRLPRGAPAVSRPAHAPARERPSSTASCRA